MTSRVEGRICVSRHEAAQVRTLLDSYRGSVGGVTGQYLSVLVAELNRARVLGPEAVPDDVVGLGSTVRITDLDTGSSMKLTIVLPERATADGRVSVLSPLGMALFGYRKGHTVEWGPVSHLLRYRIDDVSKNGRTRKGWATRRGAST